MTTEAHELAMLARETVGGAERAVLRVLGGEPGTDAAVVAIQDDNGWPVFWCDLGSRVADAARRLELATLTVRGGGPGHGEVAVVLTGRLELIGRGHGGGRPVAAVLLATDRIHLETAAPGGASALRHEVPPDDYVRTCPDALADWAGRLVAHTNEAHLGDMRRFVARRAGVPERLVAGAWLAGLDRQGLLASWVDESGAHSVRVDFPVPARTTTELAMRLRDRLSAGQPAGSE
ncbi:DUF2470 domain-containing protein [Streptomyces sp. NPDC050560]|uniref:DUF2470 domain-containing protein n=1 Tax=Streptomyces sp. NPDC050560 TaxID=3365630 RepID=UPI0037AE22F2